MDGYRIVVTRHAIERSRTRWYGDWIACSEEQLTRRFERAMRKARFFTLDPRGTWEVRSDKICYIFSVLPGLITLVTCYPESVASVDARQWTRDSMKKKSHNTRYKKDRLKRKIPYMKRGKSDVQ